MRRLVNTIALGAAMIALALAIWRDYGATMALKQAVTIYLAAYFVAGGLGLATRAALTAVRDPEPEPEPGAEKGRIRRKRRPARMSPDAAAATAAPPAATPENETAAPEPAHAG